MDNSPIFILACGRSGTTLLRSMLTCHSRIAIPRASHFIVELHDQFGGTALADITVARQAIERLLSHERVADFAIDRNSARARMETITAPTVADLCRVIFEEYARSVGKPRWGDKTTTYGPHTALLARMFPDAKLIHLHRDGRDVVTSLRSVPFGQATAYDAARHWKDTVTAIRRARQRLARHRYMEVSYESLLEDPTATLTAVCAFLGEAFEPGMLNYTDKVDELILPQDNPYHRRLREKPAKEMLYRWKHNMSEGDRAIVEHIAGDELKALGYPLSEARLSTRMRAGLLKASARRSASQVKRWIVSLPIPQKSRVRRVIVHSSDYLNTTRLRSARLRPHDNLDRDLHLREAYAWICRAQDAGGDEGVSRGSRIGSGVFQPSYPETTGYIIPTMIDAAQRFGLTEYVDRAIRMGDWEIEIQMAGGAVMGGTVGQQARPAVFNTGQVMHGWNALFKATGESKYLDAARRAADWLLEIQEPDGDWIMGHSQHAAPRATTYNTRVAWALCRTGQLCSDDRYVVAARRFIDLALRRQLDSGWFTDCCLTDPGHPLLHTLAYAMRGVLETGILIGNQEYIQAARRTANALAARVAADGFLPGRFGPDWAGAVKWCCLTGSAQTSIVLSRLARRAGDAHLADAARRLNAYLMRRHDLSNPDPTIRGGVSGSWPVNGEYCRFEVVNWAVKFLIDALNEEADAGSAAVAGGHP